MMLTASSKNYLVEMAPPEMHTRSYRLGACHVSAQPPVLVGQAPGHFWFPSLHPLRADRLFCGIVLTEDRAQGRWPAVLYHSGDAGRSWTRLLEPHTYGPTSVAASPDRLLLMPYETWPLAPGEKRNARAEGSLIRYDAGGQMRSEMAEVRFLGFPFDLADYHAGELMLLTNGNVLRLGDGRWFTTLYGRVAGEAKDSLFAMTSEDDGHHWQFLSIVARGTSIPGAVEGANESNTARLANGRLLCVFRTGSGQEYHRSYSSDDGLTWSEPQRMPGVWSVEPALRRLGNGLIVLSGGRPGLFLWICADGQGNHWDPFNLAAHHNAACADSSLHYSEAFCQPAGNVDPAQSTSYTGLAVLSADEVLVCYDRLGNGWAGAPGPWGETDSVFCVRLKITRSQ